MSGHGQVVEHIVITTKYRRQFLANKRIRRSTRALIEYMVERKGGELLALTVMSDHVHILVGMPMTVSTAQMVQYIKWYSSLRLRRSYGYELKEFNGRKQDALWSGGYHATGVGYAGTKTVKKYINEQFPKEEKRD